MNEQDVEQIVKNIKFFKAIDAERKVIGAHSKDCNFTALLADGKVTFDIDTLQYLSPDEVFWILLHEEAHLIYNQEAKIRQSFRDKVMYVFLFGTIIFDTYLFVFFSIPIIPYYFLSLLFVSLIIMFFTVFIDYRYFYQPYWKDEYRSDEHAVKELFIIKPDSIPWQLMYSSFKAFEMCRKNRKISFIRSLIVRIRAKPHPPNNARIQNVRILYNKYRENRRLIT